MLYRSTDCLCRCGAPVQNLAHSASLHAGDNNAPSKSGIKHLAQNPPCGQNDQNMQSRQQQFVQNHPYFGDSFP